MEKESNGFNIIIKVNGKFLRNPCDDKKIKYLNNLIGVMSVLQLSLQVNWLSLKQVRNILNFLEPIHTIKFSEEIIDKIINSDYFNKFKELKLKKIKENANIVNKLEKELIGTISIINKLLISHYFDLQKTGAFLGLFKKLHNIELNEAQIDNLMKTKYFKKLNDQQSNVCPNILK